METKFKGYSRSFVARTLPNGAILVHRAEQYIPDSETEIYKSTNNELRDLTDKELNEIMEELERGPIKIEDAYPLKNIREKALNA